MSPLKLKVCGMRNANNILTIANMNPDFMGFIFYKNSPRFVGHDFETPNRLNKNIKRVGVFVNADFEEITSAVQRHQLDMVQLHGDETIELCRKLKSQVQVIKVFAVDHTFDFGLVKPFEAVVDYFLFDTKGAQRGGNGISFDWRLLNDYQGSIPFFLSGGISIDNIGKVAAMDHPLLFAIDVNSGVEIEPGIKDLEKFNTIRNLMKSI